MQKKLSIIIINFYSEELILECVKSIYKYNINALKEGSIEIIIVDNGSSSNSLKSIQNSETKLIVNKSNKGFGSACNLAVKESKSEYILFLNPDTRVFKNSISNSIFAMEKNPNITVLGCKQIDENNKTHRSCARYVTLGRYLNKISKLNKLFPYYFKGYHMSDWDHEKSRFVDHVIGAFYLIRRTDFFRVNGFDENFFVYYEDLDLSRKITKIGGKIFYDADVEIFHMGGGASKKVKAMRLFYSLDSLLVYGKKYFTKTKYIILALFILGIEPFFRLFSLLIKLNFKNIKQLFSGYRMLYAKRILK